jgi:hypothetical protein
MTDSQTEGQIPPPKGEGGERSEPGGGGNFAVQKAPTRPPSLRNAAKFTQAA